MEITRESWVQAQAECLGHQVPAFRDDRVVHRFRLHRRLLEDPEDAQWLYGTWKLWQFYAIGNKTTRPLSSMHPFSHPQLSSILKKFIISAVSHTLENRLYRIYRIL
jgi:hypothetical protein